jgi:hypothetical protein
MSDVTQLLPSLEPGDPTPRLNSCTSLTMTCAGWPLAGWTKRGRRLRRLKSGGLLSGSRENASDVDEI